MWNALAAEFRKLYTVRSTYGAAAIAGLLTILFVIVHVFHPRGTEQFDAHSISYLILDLPRLMCWVGAVVGLLIAVYEYRYNTITYTLIASNSRLKVLVAKTIVVIVYSAIISLLCSLLALGAYRAGLAMAGTNLPHQTLNLPLDLAKTCFYNVAYGLAGFLFGIYARSIAAPLVAIFIVPSAIEPLLGIALKKEAMYLPFSGLLQIINHSNETGTLSPVEATLLATGYIVIGWVIAALLFARRDASQQG